MHHSLTSTAYVCMYMYMHKVNHTAALYEMEDISSGCQYYTSPTKQPHRFASGRTVHEGMAKHSASTPPINSSA